MNWYKELVTQDDEEKFNIIGKKSISINITTKYQYFNILSSGFSKFLTVLVNLKNKSILFFRGDEFWNWNSTAKTEKS